MAYLHWRTQYNAKTKIPISLKAQREHNNHNAKSYCYWYTIPLWRQIYEHKPIREWRDNRSKHRQNQLCKTRTHTYIHMHSYRQYVWFLIINPATVQLNNTNVNLVKFVNFIFCVCGYCGVFQNVCLHLLQYKQS